jgi:hypothetical protein
MAIGFLFSGCNKDKEINSYPDCFSNWSSIASSNVRSCGYTVMINVSKTQLIAVVVNDLNLDLTAKCKTFDLAQHTSDISVSYFSYGNNPDSVYFNYCDDVLYPPGYYGSKTEWTAVSGNIKLVVSKERKYRRECEEQYKMCLSLENVKFVKQNSSQDSTVQLLIVKDVIMGLCIP